jgi:4-amino-4-deoxy-L-arabinose transferase-like glycosyltransferase
MNRLINIYNKIYNTNLNRIFCLAICLISCFNASYLSSKFFKNTETDFKTGYYIGAVNIKNGNGYTNNDGELITHWPPGYSFFIAPFVSSSLESSMNRIKIVNGLLSILWVFLLFKIFKKSIPKVPTFIPLGLAVFWPPMLAIGNPELSELLFATIITLSIYILFFLFSKKNAITLIFLSVSLGVLFGFAVLIKTLAIPTFLFTIVLLLFVWKNVKALHKSIYIIVTLISFGIIVMPWIITFYNYTGQIGFTTAGLHSIKDGIKQFPHLEAGKFLISKFDSWSSFYDVVIGFYDSLIKYPLSTLFMVILKSIRCWYGTDSGRFETIMIFINIPCLVLFIISLIRIIKSSMKTLPIIVIIIGYIIGFWLTSILVLSIFRYMTPIFPFVILIIFYSIFNPNTNINKTVEKI